ncbi:MAG: hypothetical protein RL133_716 [Pseudomonadota bacterium]
MRGMMFVSFIDWTEQAFGEDVADDILCHTPTATGGAYTNVGQYEYEELLALIQALSLRVEQPVPDLCKAFGLFLLPVLITKHQDFIDASAGLHGFLSGLDSHIHKEVLRLYPNSLPPRVRLQPLSEGEPDAIELQYESHRPMADLAHGLLLGAVSYFKSSATVIRQDDASRADFAHFRVELKAK